MRISMQNLTNYKGKNYISSVWHKGHGKEFCAINPADNKVIYKGYISDAVDVHNALTSAHDAYHTWSKLSVAARLEYIKKYANIIKKNLDTLTHIIALETGKPIWESKGEAQSVFNKVAISIDAYFERTNTIHFKDGEIDNYIRYKPFGVAAVIGPFNFPAHLINGHIIPALIAGNTIVLKPSHLTPLSAEFIVKCFTEIKLPKGVLNLVQGDGATAKNLLKNDINAVYFTGSFNTGVKINKQFASRPDILLAMEMGGNNPLIIDKVKNIDAAVYHSVISAFIGAGQRCTCARRIIIPDNKYGDNFLKKFIELSRTITIGKYDNKPEPFMGPVIRYSHALSHLKAQKHLISIGGEALLQMSLLEKKLPFLSPGIIDMSTVKNAPDEEIFAPIVQIYKYDSFEDALSIANNTQYGLSSGIFTDSKKHFEQFFYHIKAGLINLNRPTTGASSRLPFGGVGKSGNFRPSAYFAADYCAYPVASLEQKNTIMPAKISPGINLYES